MMNRDECYRILGVNRGASPEEIKKAYRMLVKVWHPDRLGKDPRLREKAEEMLKKINEAYHLITNLPPEEGDASWNQREGERYYYHQNGSHRYQNYGYESHSYGYYGAERAGGSSSTKSVFISIVGKILCTAFIIFCLLFHMVFIYPGCFWGGMAYHLIKKALSEERAPSPLPDQWGEEYDSLMAEGERNEEAPLPPIPVGHNPSFLLGEDWYPSADHLLLSTSPYMGSPLRKERRWGRYWSSPLLFDDLRDPLERKLMRDLFPFEPYPHYQGLNEDPLFEDDLWEEP